MDTLRLVNGATKLIAHRGLSSIEMENTNSAFVAAGNRSHWGIETAVHCTSDNQFIIIHDDDTARVAGDKLIVEETSFETLRSIRLFDMDGQRRRRDLIMPSLTVLAAKKGFLVPKTVWHFSDQSEWSDEWKANNIPAQSEDSEMPLWKAWLPYCLIAVLLVITRIPALGIKQLLQSDMFVIRFDEIFGVPNTAYTLKWAFLPGIMFIVVAIITVFIQGMGAKKTAKAWKDTAVQVAGAAVAKIFGLALVQILRFSGSNDVNDPGMKSMVFYMAEALSQFGRVLLTIFSPIIGILGAFVSGSNTVSNTLFTKLQYQSAQTLGLPGVLFVAMQTIGGSIGNMVCVNNTVAVCATVGTNGKEGRIIRINIIPMLIYTAAIIAVFAVLIFVVGD